MQNVQVQSERFLRLKMANARSLKQEMRFRLDVLSSMPEFENMASKIRSCTDSKPCQQEDCFRCGVPRNYKGHSSDREVQYQKAPRYDEIEPPKRSRNYRKRGGQHLEAVFNHFDPATVFALSVHIAVVPLQDDIAAEVRKSKARFKKRLERIFGKRCVFRGFVEDKVYRVRDALKLKALKDNSWADGLSENDLVVNLHIHGSIHVDGLSKLEIKQALVRRGFDGARQVHLQAHYDKRTHDKRSTGGIRGWGEYASKRLIELTFGPQNLEVYLRVRRYREELGGKVRHIGLNIDKYLRRGPTYLCESPMSIEEFEQDMLVDAAKWKQ